MSDAYANFAYSTVAVAPSPPTSGTVLTVALGDGARYPVPPFNVVVCSIDVLPIVTNAEILRVTAIVGDTLTVERAQEGTLARAIVIGDQCYASITQKTLDDLAAGSVGPQGPEGPPGPPGPPGASTSIFYWRADAQSQAANDPGSGKLRWNATPQINATAIYVDRITERGLDVTAIFTAMTFAPELLIQDSDFALNFQKWTMTGPAVAHPDWFEVPVVFVESGGNAQFTNNQELAVAVQSAGAVGPQGPAGPPGPAGNPTGTEKAVQFNQGGLLTGSDQLVFIPAPTGTPELRIGQESWGHGSLRLGGTHFGVHDGTFSANLTVVQFAASAIVIFGVAQLGEMAFAARPTPVLGALVNFGDSTTNTPGAVVAGGGTFHVLARYNGTNWIVIGG